MSAGITKWEDRISSCTMHGSDNHIIAMGEEIADLRAALASRAPAAPDLSERDAALEEVAVFMDEYQEYGGIDFGHAIRAMKSK